jgi:hypothetical protein
LITLTSFVEECGRVREFVGSLVERVTVVSLDPLPRDMWTVEVINLDPEFTVLDWLSRRGLPTVLLPTVDPLRDSILEITTVSVQSHFLLSSVLETLESSREFHGVVCRVGQTS